MLKRVALLTLSLLLIAMGGMLSANDLTPEEELGKKLFFDENLSTPPGQSCASCHAPLMGWTGPDSQINATQAIYPGAVHTRFGNRKPPTSAYGGDSPVLHYDGGEGVWVGGMFWDGRATGWELGDPLQEQALGPFLNPLEMKNPNPRLVIIKILTDPEYVSRFEQVYGFVMSPFTVDVEELYRQVGQAIAAYERSKEVNPFTSKYDYFLKDEVALTEQEALGLELFNGKAMCSACHLSEGSPPLFTDFTYDNLGIPKNPENPFYNIPKKWNPDGADWVDYGLGGFLKKAGYNAGVYEPELGKHKVPTLRNVDMRPNPEFVKAFGHNGYFKSLEEIVHFYNTRDVQPWPPPEYPSTVNTDELGNLGLTAEEEAAIVAFMKTLTDGYTP